MWQQIITGHEIEVLVRLGVAIACGFVIGIERESRKKSAGISTHSFVISGSAMFTFMSLAVDPNSPARIAAQVVTGVGFLGAGIILKNSDGKITNLTTAASIWFTAAIGMMIGFGWFVSGIICAALAVLIPRIPHLATWKDQDE